MSGHGRSLRLHGVRVGRRRIGRGLREERAFAEESRESKHDRQARAQGHGVNHNTNRKQRLTGNPSAQATSFESRIRAATASALPPDIKMKHTYRNRLMVSSVSAAALAGACAPAVTTPTTSAPIAAAVGSNPFFVESTLPYRAP